MRAKTTSRSATASACCATSPSGPGSSACRSFPWLNPSENTIADQLLGWCFLRGRTLLRKKSCFAPPSGTTKQTIEQNGPEQTDGPGTRKPDKHSAKDDTIPCALSDVQEPSAIKWLRVTSDHQEVSRHNEKHHQSRQPLDVLRDGGTRGLMLHPRLKGNNAKCCPYPGKSCSLTSRNHACFEA